LITFSTFEFKAAFKTFRVPITFTLFGRKGSFMEYQTPGLAAS